MTKYIRIPSLKGFSCEGCCFDSENQVDCSDMEGSLGKYCVEKGMSYIFIEQKEETNDTN